EIVWNWIICGGETITPGGAFPAAGRWEVGRSGSLVPEGGACEELSRSKSLVFHSSSTGVDSPGLTTAFWPFSRLLLGREQVGFPSIHSSRSASPTFLMFQVCFPTECCAILPNSWMGSWSSSTFG